MQPILCATPCASLALILILESGMELADHHWRSSSPALDVRLAACSRRLTWYEIRIMYFFMILSFADRATEVFFTHGMCPAEWRPFSKVAKRKLDMLDAAVRLETMRSPPGNRLEALKGDRRGQWSIRINDQWRICFKWTDKGPTEVEIVDYH